MSTTKTPSKQDSSQAKKSISQTLQLPGTLYNRAEKYEKATGIKVTAQIRTALNEFLSKNNF